GRRPTFRRYDNSGGCTFTVATCATSLLIIEPARWPARLRPGQPSPLMAARAAMTPGWPMSFRRCPACISHMRCGPRRFEKPTEQEPRRGGTAARRAARSQPAGSGPGRLSGAPAACRLETLGNFGWLLLVRRTRSQPGRCGRDCILEPGTPGERRGLVLEKL